jgi:hypothetical protein
MAADYSHKFVRVTFSGTVFNGAEEWSTNLNIGWEDANIDEINPGIAEEIAGYWETFYENAAHAISNSWRCNEVKCAVINTNGKTDLDNIDYFTYSGGIFGGQGGTPFPPQITLAATMTSDQQRGLAAKGRMYLPGVISGIDGGTGKLGSAFTNTLNTGFKTFLDALNADTDIPGSVILASKGHKTDQLDADGQPVYENGINTFVTGCRIGNVYDTQRRRRNNLTETYDTKVLA